MDGVRVVLLETLCKAMTAVKPRERAGVTGVASLEVVVV